MTATVAPIAGLDRWPGLALALAVTLADPAQSASSRGPAATAVEIATACSAAPDIIPALAGIDVAAMAPAAEGDLPYLLVSDRASGATIRIYHDPGLAAVARARAACLGGSLTLLPANIPDGRTAISWAPIVLTLDPSYIPPRSEFERRWVLPDFTGRWDQRATAFLVRVMPHEETHDSQNRRRTAQLPRWFQEGHAEWAGLKVTKQVAPAEETRRRKQLAADLAALPAPALGQWGGRRVKQEAIDRQLSPADRERRAREPGWSPPGPFSFSPNDFFEDNANEEGRYGAALALFDGLEQRHGQAAVLKWIAAVLADGDNKRIAVHAREILGEDISLLLK